MSSNYQLKITEIINGNAKKLVLNSSGKKSTCFITKTCKFI